MRKVEMIVINEEQLKNPVIVYSVITQWMREAGEDFIDTNESFIKGEAILDWILSKNYCIKEKYDYIIENDETWIQDLLLGYETGLLNGESFPSSNKAYQIISEYISESKELRERFIYCFCTSFSEAEDGIRDPLVTGVQTCALPIFTIISTFLIYFSSFLIPT